MLEDDELFTFTATPAPEFHIPVRVLALPNAPLHIQQFGRAARLDPSCWWDAWVKPTHTTGGGENPMLYSVSAIGLNNAAEILADAVAGTAALSTRYGPSEAEQYSKFHPVAIHELSHLTPTVSDEDE